MDPTGEQKSGNSELASVLRSSTIWLTFVETRPFSARWHARLGDEDLRALQNELLDDPGRGDRIPGCGILRKMRFGDHAGGKGKRGGVRVIYMHTPDAARIDLIAVYGKNEKDNLAKDEIKLLCELAHQLREQLTPKSHQRNAGRRKKGNP